MLLEKMRGSVQVVAAGQFAVPIRFFQRMSPRRLVFLEKSLAKLVARCDVFSERRL